MLTRPAEERKMLTALEDKKLAETLRVIEIADRDR